MPSDATFGSFEKELNRLVESFGNRLAELKSTDYNEAKLRDDFLNPFFRALGWDMENRAGLIQKEREVEIESATQIGGGRKRADYLFRTDKRDRLVCEAKKPAEELHARYAFQAKRYAWNKGVPVAILTDFEEFKIYIVGGKPHLDEPHVGEWKNWHFRQYPLIARELWDLLARDKIAADSIDQMLEALPRKAAGTGKARQQWLIKPDRTRALDADFLEFLDETRRELASDIYKNNDHDELLEGNKLTEAVQRIIDRILFLRICEDRDIDTGTTLQSIVETWRKNTGNDDTGRRAHQQPFELHEEPPADHGTSGIRAPKDSLWRYVVRHFRALDRRPPTHVPFFNGNLFKPHFTETLVIGDEWLAGFIGDLSDDESPYLFNVIDVEILGSVYERFLGKVVRPQGRGITIEEKPEVRKAGGVYYTPRYIVNYIVEQTAGKLLDEISDPGSSRRKSAQTSSTPKSDQSRLTSAATLKDFEKRTAALRLLDPACGSGSFLIRAFERVGEHWLRWLTSQLPAKTEKTTDVDWEKISKAPVGTKPEAPAKGARSEWLKRHRQYCWLDESTGDLHLTIHLKRLILTQNIYGVDLDAAAVEVTQLSLYLKMLENENRTTLQRQRELLADENDIALLPPLQDNIKCGNSLIASDFSMMPEDLVRVHAFDWPVQFAPILKAGGFDAVIGNPPYVYGRDWAGLGIGDDQKKYFSTNYSASPYQLDLFSLFMERAIWLTVFGGATAQIVPNVWLTNRFSKTTREYIFSRLGCLELTAAPSDVFDGIVVDTVIYCGRKGTTAPTFELARITERFVEKIGTFPCADYADGATPITTTSSKNVIELARKLVRIHASLGSVTEMTRGVHPYRADGFGESAFQKGYQTQRDVDERPYHSALRKSGWSPFIYGKDLHRLTPPIHHEYVKYGPWLAEPRDSRFFTGPRVYSRKILGDRLVVTYEEADSVADQQVYISKPIGSGYSAKYLTGILGSKLVAFFIRAYFDECTKAFPQIKVSQLREVPIAKPDKARHDKLVLLVDKMLGLMPKLRAATADSEKAVLQNAVTATDQQIDQLVYELYGLTAEEIKLVEGTQ